MSGREAGCFDLLACQGRSPRPNPHAEPQGRSPARGPTPGLQTSESWSIRDSRQCEVFGQSPCKRPVSTGSGRPLDPAATDSAMPAPLVWLSLTASSCDAVIKPRAATIATTPSSAMTTATLPALPCRAVRGSRRPFRRVAPDDQSLPPGGDSGRPRRARGGRRMNALEVLAGDQPAAWPERAPLAGTVLLLPAGCGAGVRGRARCRPQSPGNRPARQALCVGDRRGALPQP